MSLSRRTKKWIEKNCGVSLEGKTVLVTGANSGVGFKTAEIAAYLGARVIMACRSTEKAEKAAETILMDYPDASVKVMRVDLADFRSIDAFAEELRNTEIDVDAFVNNAGVFRHPGEVTADGLELVIGTNYLGTYRLTEKVLPYLTWLPHPVYLINTISIIHKTAGRIDYGDFWLSKRYGDIKAYSRSKLCLAKYTYALAKRYEGTNVRVMMNHPGISITPLGVGAFGKIVKKLAVPFGRLFNSPEKSALSVVWIMAHDVPAGSIVGPTKLFGGWGYPRQNRILKKVKTGAEELEQFTEREIGRIV